MDQRTLRSRCACGWESVGSETVLVAATMDHARRIHDMEATPDQVLARAEVVMVADDPPPAA